MPKDHDSPVIVFDVNETLLDIDTLSPFFATTFGDERVMREWFAQLVLYSQTLTVAQQYIPFNRLAIGTLGMLGKIHKVSIDSEQEQQLQSLIGAMPAHPDVIPALKQLKDAGFRLVTLTNSPPPEGTPPLDKAGLTSYFDCAFSVDQVKTFKPAKQTYELVAGQMQTDLSQLCMVACHLWDVLGAQAAGCVGAFVKRPHNAVLQVDGVALPDISADSLPQAAEKIINRFKSS